MENSNNIMIIELTNEKAAGLLHELENLQLIKVLEIDNIQVKQKLSEKYKGVFSKADAESFIQHTKMLRQEWENT